MSTALKRALRVVLAIPAIGFVVTGLRFAVSPSAAAKGLEMPLLDGAARRARKGLSRRGLLGRERRQTGSIHCH
jgi:hypothetical protein